MFLSECKLTIPYKSKIETYVLYPATMTTPYTEYETNYGYYLEGLIKYKLNNNFSITTGFNYKFISYKILDIWNYNISEGKINNYIFNIPFFLNYKLSEKIPITVSAGPYIELLIKARETGVTYIDTSKILVIDPNDPLLKEQNYDNNLIHKYKPINYGLSIQLEYEHKFSKKMSGILLSRFNYGLNNVLIDNLEKRPAFKNSAIEWKNYNILIGLGIKI